MDTFNIDTFLYNLMETIYMYQNILAKIDNNIYGNKLTLVILIDNALYDKLRADLQHNQTLRNYYSVAIDEKTDTIRSELMGYRIVCSSCIQGYKVVIDLEDKE